MPRPRKLTFDLLTLKVVLMSESRVTWATSVPPWGRGHNNNTQDDIYSAVIMTIRSLREFTRFIYTLHRCLIKQ